MKLGLQVPVFTFPQGQEHLGDTFGLIAERAEQVGLYSFWVMDHFFQIAVFGPPEQEMLEGWSALAFAAGRTKQIKLGTMVTGITYRHPGLLVKTATTLDVLSKGRAYFGVGAAWNEEEHQGLGVPFPPLKERFERLEETLQIAHQMWAGDETPFEGKHYQLQRPLNSPQSVQKSHPPILIGGAGEKKTLRLVAKYGDACNFTLRLGADVVAHKLNVLREHCATEGRPYEAIEKTTIDSFALTRDGRNGTVSPAQAIEKFAALAEMGIDHALFSLQNIADSEPFEVLNNIVPVVDKIPVAGR
ncbi:LLM class F420-dependent oxidoreductase [Ktedonospora formicarum]|uniref:LLM class F420-dependent oxidoreductase n=1 Tax=Ktedonospora formicarum TaxID=2778364 RepID=A0A8J3I6V9_9CHLR|nr:LLM class F420-dependent oxidoreductase [Ktedonospora formicarum]GHO48188.1 LLM class F420-dependent oxidoreductase [Ktedonospora formicarum]